MKYRVTCANSKDTVSKTGTVHPLFKSEDVEAGNWELAIEIASMVNDDCDLFTVVGYFRGSGEYRRMKMLETYKIEDNLDKTLVERRFVSLPRNKKGLEEKVNELLLPESFDEKIVGKEIPTKLASESEKEEATWDQDTWNSLFPTGSSNSN